MLTRAMTTAKGIGIALASAILVASVAAACTSIAHGHSSQPKFTITNTISSSSANQTPALLYPGVPDFLWYTAHNPLTVPITVRTLSISSVTPPAGCPTSNLDYASTTFTGSLVVPAQGTNSVPVPISLFETHTNQDSVRTQGIPVLFPGIGDFQRRLLHPDKVSSSHNPSVIGQSVTYTATVISGGGTGNHYNSGDSTGTVTFYDGSTAICTAVPVSSAFEWVLARLPARLLPISRRDPSDHRRLYVTQTATSPIRRRRCSIKWSNRRESPPRS